MPELPEVETIVRSLSPILGRKVDEIRILNPKPLRGTDPESLIRLKGRAVCGLRRRGKLLLIEMEGGKTLVIHFKMTGQLRILPVSEPEDRHTHLVFIFSGGKEKMAFRDVRKFGFFLCLPTEGVMDASPLSELGPEPLEISFLSFRSLFGGKKGRLKALLLNQSFIAGIGNIYADEILFKANIHPETPAHRISEKQLKRLYDAIQSVLKEAILRKGSSIRDFIDGGGEKGGYQQQHRVYGRQGLPCFECGSLLHRIRAAGRSTVFCPCCQKKV